MVKMSQPGIPYRMNAACSASLKWLGPALPVTVLHHGMFMVPGEMFWAWEVRGGERPWQQEGVGWLRAEKLLHKAQQRVYLIPGYHLISEGSLGLSSFLLLGSFVSVLLKLQLTL